MFEMFEILRDPLFSPPGVTLYDGDNGEKYYYDEDGFIYHVPRRTVYSHPYSFDPVTLIHNPGEVTGRAYSDRLAQWDYEKFRRCMGDGGEGNFNWGSRTKVQKLLSEYFDDDTIAVRKVMKTCNIATGDPVWYITWHSTKDKK